MARDAVEAVSPSLDRRNLSDLVAERLKEYILEKGLRAGDRLPTEHELAERFGVSRISVREATRALAFLGVLNARPGRGIVVGRLDMARVSQYVGFHLALSDLPNRQLIETRSVIEVGALPYTILRLREAPEIANRLEGINRRLSAARRRKDRIRLDIEFHRTLLEASDITPLLAFSDLLDVFFRRFRETVPPREWKKGVASHRRIIAALEGGELEEASRELRAHIESHRSRSSGTRGD